MTYTFQPGDRARRVAGPVFFGSSQPYRQVGYEFTVAVVGDRDIYEENGTSHDLARVELVASAPGHPVDPALLRAGDVVRMTGEGFATYLRGEQVVLDDEEDESPAAPAVDPTLVISYGQLRVGLRVYVDDETEPRTVRSTIQGHFDAVDAANHEVCLDRTRAVGGRVLAPDVRIRLAEPEPEPEPAAAPEPAALTLADLEPNVLYRSADADMLYWLPARGVRLQGTAVRGGAWVDLTPASVADLIPVPLSGPTEVISATLTGDPAEFISRYDPRMLPMFEAVSKAAEDAGHCSEYERLAAVVGAPGRREVERLVAERDRAARAAAEPARPAAPTEDGLYLSPSDTDYVYERRGSLWFVVERNVGSRVTRKREEALPTDLTPLTVAVPTETVVEVRERFVAVGPHVYDRETPTQRLTFVRHRRAAEVATELNGGESSWFPVGRTGWFQSSDAAGYAEARGL